MVYKRYTTTKEDVEFDLRFHDRLTLVMGDSGCGKTFLFRALQRDSVLNAKNNMICINADTPHVTDILDHFWNKSKNNLIIIDNAETIITEPRRLFISMDKYNQYIIFTQATQGFVPVPKSVAELKIVNKRGELVYSLL